VNHLFPSPAVLVVNILYLLLLHSEEPSPAKILTVYLVNGVSPVILNAVLGSCRRIVFI
jgi:hypothetical protein